MSAAPSSVPSSAAPVSAIPPFNDQALLTTALTHRSALNEHISSSAESNERLEYLGDAVLELVTSDFLFRAYPSEQEGMLTVYRSALVKTPTLAEVAEQLQLGEQLFMSKGEEVSGGRKNTSLLANTFEALLGAIYLDQGIEAVQKLLEAYLFPKMDIILQKRLYKHAKSHLQEVLQAQGISTPEYTVVDQQGPDHDRFFTVQVKIHGQDAGTGVGKSKQAAEEAAAQAVLENETRLNELLGVTDQIE